MSTPKGPGVAELVVGDAPEAWAAAGFTVGDDDTVLVGSTRLRLVGDDGERGIHAWTLRTQATGDLDGLATRWRTNDPPAPPPAHRNGTIAIDHVVVGSPNRDRTVAAIRATLGLEPRRQTEHDLDGRPMVQTFYVLDDLVLEVISRPQDEGEGPATFWGLAFTVADLEATARSLGDALGPARDAVQPGRRIATLHGRDLGVSVPVAFLNPRRSEHAGTT